MASLTIGQPLISSMLQRAVNSVSNDTSRTITRLSSGLRINSASDDAAGLAIAATLNSQSRVNSQAVKNVNDAISVVSVANQALSSLVSINERQQELASQAANGFYSNQQRSALNSEMSALTEEFNRIVNTTQFNGVALFEKNSPTLQVQAGASTDSVISAAIGDNLNISEVGNGTFELTQALTSLFSAYRIASGDFNGDGYEDIVASPLSGSMWVYFNNGDGTYAVPAVLSYGGGGSNPALTVADLNGDGRDDIVRVDTTNKAYIYSGNSDKTFQGPSVGSIETTYLKMNDGSSINTDDYFWISSPTRSYYAWFDKDSAPATAETTYLRMTSPGSINQGDYFWITAPAASIYPQRTYYTWFDWTPLTTTDDPGYGSYGIRVVLTTTMTTPDQVAAAVAAAINSQAAGLSATAGVAHFDNVGTLRLTATAAGDLPDLSNGIGATYTNSEIIQGQSVYTTPDPGYGTYGIRVVISSGSTADQVAASLAASINVQATGYLSATVAVTYFDNVGDLKITTTAFGNPADPSVGLGTTYTNSAVIEGRPDTVLTTGTTPVNVLATDLNGDGLPDLVTTDQASLGVSVLLTNPDGSFQTRVAYSVFGSAASTAAGDFDGDGKTDLMMVSSAVPNVYFLKGNGNGTFQTAQVISSGETNTHVSITAGDIDNDGKLDVLLGGTPAPNALTVLWGDGAGHFSARSVFTDTFSGPARGPALGDLNSDGYLDIVSNSSAYFLSSGARTYSDRQTLSDVTPPLSGALVSDFNGDGIDDIAIGKNDARIRLFSGLGESAPTMRDVSIASQEEALTAIDTLSDIKNSLLAEQGSLGAIAATLESSSRVLVGTRDNQIAAASRITDADIASEAANLVKDQVRQQSLKALYASANQNSKIVLDLLKFNPKQDKTKVH